MTAAAIGLVEREQELARINRALTLARAGDGSLVILEGPAGIGKSALLGAAGQAARDHGTEVLQARGIDLEQDAPFGVAASLLGDAVQRLSEDENARVFEGPARAARWVVDPSVPAPGEPHALTRGLFALTVNLARPSGLAILVDDVQWADRPSMALLAYLAVRLVDLPIALVLAVRTGEPSAAPGVLQAIRQEPRCTVIVPPPLSEAAVGQVIREEFPDAEPEFITACARASGGNPYFCRELVSALREEGVAPIAESAAVVALHVPDSVLRALLLRLARVGDDAAGLAAAAAILDDGAALRHAATLARLEPRAAERAADALVAGGFLAPAEPLRFSHPLIATAIRADMPPFARLRAHRTAAGILHADGAATREVAAHLLLARPDGELWTVEMMRAAGREALVAGDPLGAVRLLSRALQEPPPASERARVLIELAEAKALLGGEDAEDLIAEAVTLLDDERARAGALRALSRIRLATGDHAAASEALRPVLAGLDGDDPERQQILAEYLTLNTFRARLRPEAERVLSPIIQAARAGAPPEHPGLLAHVVLRLAFAGERPETIRALVSRVGAEDALVDVETHGMLAGILVQALCCVDELDVAERMAGAAVAAAADRGAFFAAAAAAYHQAIPLVHRGAFAPALQALDASLVPSREGWTGAQAWPASLQAHVHLARGDVAAARDSLASVSVPPLDAMEHPILCFARSAVALASRDFAAARADATEAGRVLGDEFGIDHPGFIPWRRVAALAAAALGDRELARELAESQLTVSRVSGAPRAMSIALRTLAGLESRESRVDLLRQAWDAVADSPCQLERAHALTDLGRALRRVGRHAEAQEMLRRALELADAIGAVPLVSAAATELRATGARPRRAALTGAASLTPAERRVADRAAAGLTNAQIAQELVVTAKTVETHLARVYRKLDITSRRALATALGGPVQTQPPV